MDMKLAIALLALNLFGCAVSASQARSTSHAVVRDGGGSGATTNTGSGTGGTPIQTPHPNV